MAVVAIAGPEPPLHRRLHPLVAQSPIIERQHVDARLAQEAELPALRVSAIRNG